ncbi:Alpha/Beta hydrolase protein [Xylariales sp. PMI_506]|nr:Alpha/Beta hydrolase protein [Xylariales sp. PMI_506]
MALSRLFAATFLVASAVGQLPPTPEGVTWLKSKFHENVTISFKEPGLCETTPGVKSYAGYVHLPAGSLDVGPGETQDYPINTFFWFFEARKDPHNAPLAIWLNGGPGGSSLMGLLEENGPCFIAEDSKSTFLNPWSWNNEVNMLYIDQPTQVGFSYDVPTNGTMDLVFEVPAADYVTTPKEFKDGVIPESNLTNRVGTFASQNLNQTAHTTLQAAHALWHFAQAWFYEFPHYKPNDDRISLWAESYGGHYGPGIARFFQEQNQKIANGSSAEDGAQYIHLDTLGIVNGLLDTVIQGEAYIDFPYNNTYGIQVFDEALHTELKYNWTKPGGCKERMIACQDSLRGLGLVSLSELRAAGYALPGVCEGFGLDCNGGAVDAYIKHGRGWYDITSPQADPFPPPHLYGWLTESSVLSALGVPVNYSSSSGAVAQSFFASNDVVLGGFLDAAAYLLDSGVKVHLMYGDRDFACSWVGGEAASLAIPYSRQADFAEAGYAPLVTSEGVSGWTRQLGNFSFTRVYQAGHEVPSYQPEAAYAIFKRATFGLDIPLGVAQTDDEYRTTGPSNTWMMKNEVPELPKSKCYVLKPGSCTPEEVESIRNGTAVVKDWYLVNDASGLEPLAEVSSPTHQAVIGEL